MEFTHDDIRRQFDPGTFARGEEYVRKGRVISIDIEFPDTLHGEVEGSGGKTYRQEMRVRGDWSCPMPRNG